MNPIMQRTLDQMAIRDYRWYLQLARFTPKDMVSWMHTDGGYVGQDAALSAVCTAMYSHWHFPDRPKRNLLIIGSTGSGKTQMVDTVRRWFKYASPDAPPSVQARFIRYVDSSQLVSTGYKGLHIADALNDILEPQGCILFIDEVCKMTAKSWAAGNGSEWSPSDACQHSILTLLDHNCFSVTSSTGSVIDVDGKHITVVLMGAFSDILEKKSSKRREKHLGFGNAIDYTADETEPIVTEDDLIQHGMLREVCGRCSIVQMDKPDKSLMYKVALNTIEELERTTEYHICISDDTLHDLAETAYSKNLGGRYIRNELQKRFDAQLLENVRSDTLTL